VLQGICRVHFRHWSAHTSYPHTAIEPFHSIDLPDDEAPYYTSRLRHSISRTLEMLPAKIATAINGVFDDADDPFTIADIVAQQFVTDPGVRRTLLEEPEVAKRIEILIDLLDRAKPPSQRG
jgi:ATP-dependent Lon protease